MSRRTGRLMLLPQILLADLEHVIAPEVAEELLAVAWPRITELHADRMEIEQRLAACLLAASDHHDGLSTAAQTMVLCIRCRWRPRTAKIAGPYGGGGDYVVSDGSLAIDPLRPNELVAPEARTLGLSIELSAGGRDACRAIRPSEIISDQDDATAIDRLAQALKQRVIDLPGGETLLERDPLVGIDLAATSIYHLLSHQACGRQDTQGRRLVRSDYYQAALDQLCLGSSQETLRRIIEADHPRPIDLISQAGDRSERSDSHNSNSIRVPFLIEVGGYLSLALPLQRDNYSSYSKYYKKNNIYQTRQTNIEDWIAPSKPLGETRALVTGEAVEQALLRHVQIDTALGVILQEAHHGTGETLRELAEHWASIHEIEMSRRTAEQLTSAARILEREVPGLYQGALRAIAAGEPIPTLPKYNRVVVMPGYLSGLSGEERARVVGLWLASDLPVAQVRALLRRPI